MKFGQYLVQKNIINKEALEDSLRVQRYMKKPLGRVLLDLEYLTSKELDQSLYSFLKPVCTMKVDELRSALLGQVEESGLSEWARRLKVLPIGNQNKKSVFLSPVFRDCTLLEIENQTGSDISLQTVSDDTFDYLWSLVTDGGDPNENAVEIYTAETGEQRLGQSDPYSLLLKECLAEARKQGASDIHIEPKEESVEIRFRIFGELNTWKQIDETHREQLTNLVKRIGQMDVAVTDTPQDGRISLPSMKTDLRVNTLLTIYGEKVVLRLLEQDRDFDISKVGLQEKTLKELLSAVHSKDGLFVISGPTGSGKTTTLYSLLNSLNHRILNITTLEDPVEYRLPGINQVQIGPRLTFGKALRALMRQDPDVILVGEIRDQETAELCMKAASTGHLVISTLHANGAREVIERLESLNIDRFSIASNLRFSGAQRLVPLLCEKCSIPVVSHEVNKQNHYRQRNPDGCESCRSGLVGRMPIIEYLKQEDIKSILDGHELPQYITLKSQARELADQGRVDLETVQQAA